jgi:hypothetical protein
VSCFYLFHIETKYLVNLQTFILEVTGSNFVTTIECLDCGYWQLSTAAAFLISSKKAKCPIKLILFGSNDLHDVKYKSQRSTCTCKMYVLRGYLVVSVRYDINPLTPELNPFAQQCLTRFFIGILIFKELTARRLYKSFGVKGLI